MKNTISVNRLGFLPSCSIFLSAAFLMFMITRLLIPYLSTVTGQETIVLWFIAGGLGIFTPLIILGFALLRKEGAPLDSKTFTGRLRFRRLSKEDLIWTFIGFLTVALSSSLILKVLSYFAGEFDPSPPFMAFEPLEKGRYWILAAWLPFWILNICGEEFLWRGVMFPRQEVAFGRYTWILHGFGWGLFHIAFGWALLLTLLPLIFIQSFIVQKTKNSWTGVILHAGLNGPAFVAISLGLL